MLSERHESPDNSTCRANAKSRLSHAVQPIREGSAERSRCCAVGRRKPSKRGSTHVQARWAPSGRFGQTAPPPELWRGCSCA